VSGADLRAFLERTDLPQGQFAKLLDVTPRAVSLWLAEERALPGPAEAYIRLFEAMPKTLRHIELQRLKESVPRMRDGMFAVFYHSQTEAGTGLGYATMILDGGKAYGADPFGGTYDGDYAYDEATETADVHLKVTFPPNVQAVFGPVHPYEWSIDITGKVDPNLDRGFTEFATVIGPKIKAQYQFLRTLPSKSIN
jgi:hypothetical protein